MGTRHARDDDKDYIPSFPRRRESIGNAKRRWVLKTTHRNVGFARGQGLMTRRCKDNCVIYITKVV